MESGSMTIVRLRRTEVGCLIDLYYRGRTDHELLKACASALEAGENRAAPGSVALSISSSQRETLLAASRGQRTPGLGGLVPLLKKHFDQMPSPIRRRRSIAKKRKAFTSKAKSTSVWTVSGGLPSVGRRR